MAQRRPGEPFNRAVREEALANLSRYGLGRPLDFAGMMAHKAQRMWLMYFVGGGRDRVLEVSILHVLLVLLAAAGWHRGNRRRARADSDPDRRPARLQRRR